MTSPKGPGSRGVCIEGIAYALPPQRVSSASLEEAIGTTLSRLGLPAGQLEALTGIRERRLYDADTRPSTAATEAARRLLDEVDVERESIGCLINTSVCKDYVEPSVACIVHGNLGLPATCLNYDIGNACLGFVNAIGTISSMIESGAIRYGLIVDGENAREAVEATVERLARPTATLDDYRENFATLTVGSGAVAMLLGPESVSRTGHRINGWVNLAATEHNALCVGQRDWMRVDASALLVAGVGLAQRTWRLATERLDRWSDPAIDVYTPHQVSLRNQSALNRALGITPEKVFLNLHTLGNIGPAALPITLAQAAETGRVHSGSHVGLMGIGSGLNCAMMSVDW